MARLEPGQIAPNFTLACDDGTEVTLSSLRGAPVIVYFYPKAMTTGCTAQACEYRDHMKAFSKSGAAILGISPDPVPRLVKFRDKEGITFPLLSDESHATLEAYGVWVEKSMYGKKYMGVERSTFVIDAKGKILHADYKVKSTGDAEHALALLP